MERCPNCRARWEGSTACRRCGMDLGSLLAVERAAERLISRGVGSLAVGDLAMAERVLKSAVLLRRSSFVERLLGFTRQLAEMPSEARREGNSALVGSEVQISLSDSPNPSPTAAGGSAPIDVRQ